MVKRRRFQYLRTLQGTCIQPYLEAPELLRLKGVGMHCGLEYTSFPFYNTLSHFPFSRYEHSLGVASICLRFSNDPKVAISALFHDISTPCFAHVVDFLHGDYTKQEYTEGATASIIGSSSFITSRLRQDGLTVDDVADYHRYPIADNDSPNLSSDRLEYSLSNFLRFNLLPYAKVRQLYDDLTLGINEEGEPEICFRHLDKAEEFAHYALKNGAIYSADEDRFAMEYLASTLKEAFALGLLEEKDLMGDEPTLIAKLTSSPNGKALWDDFRSLSLLKKSALPFEGGIQIAGKLRYINPYVLGKGRVSSLSRTIKREIDSFLSFDFGLYLKRQD